MVGAVRFELTTSCTRNKRATRLRYAPTLGLISVPMACAFCNSKLPTHPRNSALWRPHRSCDPFRVGENSLFVLFSGGIAALNPRLLSCIPLGMLSEARATPTSQMQRDDPHSSLWIFWLWIYWQFEAA